MARIDKITSDALENVHANPASTSLPAARSFAAFLPSIHFSLPTFDQNFWDERTVKQLEHFVGYRLGNTALTVEAVVRQSI